MGIRCSICCPVSSEIFCARHLVLNGMLVLSLPLFFSFDHQVVVVAILLRCRPSSSRRRSECSPATPKKLPEIPVTSMSRCSPLFSWGVAQWLSSLQAMSPAMVASLLPLGCFLLFLTWQPAHPPIAVSTHVHLSLCSPRGNPYGELCGTPQILPEL